MVKNYKTPSSEIILEKQMSPLLLTHLWIRDKQAGEHRTRSRVFLMAVTVTLGAVLAGASSSIGILFSTILLVVYAVLSYFVIHTRVTLRPNLSIIYEEFINKKLGEEIFTAEHLCGGLALKHLLVERRTKSPRDDALLWTSIPLYISAGYLIVGVLLASTLSIIIDRPSLTGGFWVAILIALIIGIGGLYNYFRKRTHIPPEKKLAKLKANAGKIDDYERFAPVLLALEYRNTLHETTRMEERVILNGIIGILVTFSLVLWGILQTDWIALLLSIPISVFMTILVLYCEAETRIWKSFQARTEDLFQSMAGILLLPTFAQKKMSTGNFYIRQREVIGILTSTLMIGVAILSLMILLNQPTPTPEMYLGILLYASTCILVSLPPIHRVNTYKECILPPFEYEYFK